MVSPDSPANTSSSGAQGPYLRGLPCSSEHLIHVRKMRIFPGVYVENSQCLAGDAGPFSLPSCHEHPRMMHCEDMKEHGTFMAASMHLAVSSFDRLMLNGRIRTQVQFSTSAPLLARSGTVSAHKHWARSDCPSREPSSWSLRRFLAPSAMQAQIDGQPAHRGSLQQASIPFLRNLRGSTEIVTFETLA